MIGVFRSVGKSCGDDAPSQLAMSFSHDAAKCTRGTDFANLFVNPSQLHTHTIIMSCSCKKKSDRITDEAKPDRYVSFIGLDCDAKAAQLVERICKHINGAGQNEPFWLYFKKKINGALGPRPDDLLLIHSHLNEIRELFEQRADTEGTSLLNQIEEECC